MKHLTKLALLGSVALLASACMREDVYKAPDNPTYDPVANTVKTTILLDISTSAETPQTKITAHYAQCDDNFLGMEAVHLLTYKIPYEPGGAVADSGHFFFRPYHNNQAVAATRDYDLGNLFDAGGVDSLHSSRSVELALPLETNAVVLYGKALKTASDEVQGKTYPEGNPADLSSLTFTLNPRVSDPDKFYGATLVFSNILTGFLVAGLVKEYSDDNGPCYWSAYHTTADGVRQYWKAPTGNKDRRYRFWWPKDEATTPTVDEPDPDVQKTDLTLYQDGEEYNNTGWVMHTGSITWKQLGMMYAFEHDDDANTKAEDIDPLKFTPLAESLGEAYIQLSTIRKGTTMNSNNQEVNIEELRAGSAGAVLRTIKDLYAVVAKAANSTPTNWQEEVVRQLAVEIARRTREFFTTSGNSVTGWESWTTIKEAIEANIPSYQLAEYGAALAKVNSGFLSDATGAGGFPVNIGLPSGAAVLKCANYRGTQEPYAVSDNFGQSYGSTITPDPKYLEIDVLEQFEYTTDIPAYGMGGNVTFPLFNYRYPAELMYYGNTPIRVSDEVVTKDQYPQETWTGGHDVNAWAADKNWAANSWQKNKSVTSTTRSVALTKRINYGTALLKSVVSYGSMILEDNKSSIYTSEGNNEISVSTGSFLVTGIIVGGQPETVCWDFTRAPISGHNDYNYNPTTKMYEGFVFDDGTDPTSAGYVESKHKNLFDKMIYDKVNPGIDPAVNTPNPQTNGAIYTLCWDNYDATLAADAQSDVYVALELVNNTGKDFWGEMNMVRAGGTFYLVGKLDLDKMRQPGADGHAMYEAMLADLSRRSYFYPPFNPETGETINAPRVLMQDYMTTANLKLNQYSLQHAYVTVPDLRASQVSLGLSIDLRWGKGLTFNVGLGEL